jgi:hypothetical protein
MAGAKIPWNLDKSRYFSLLAVFEMRTISASHLAGGSDTVESSDCRWAGTNRICPAGILMRVDMFLCPLTDAELHGVSSQMGRSIIARNGASLFSEEARA